VRLTLCASLLVSVLAAAAIRPVDAHAVPTCGKEGYAYAGFQSIRRAHGVRATLTSLARPWVESGHVAAWVGLGGPGRGPNGTDEWIQVGLAGLPGSTGHRLYYEVTYPGQGPAYHELLSHVDPGQRVRVAVLEMNHQPNHWRIWVNGSFVTEPIYLPRSGGRWEPIATAETWDGGRRACNGYGYRFENVRVATWRGGSWVRFRSGYRWEDPGYRVVMPRRANFRALATAVPVWRPGWWASRNATDSSAAAQSQPMKALLPPVTG
jgi:hypothetical protein